MPSELVNSVISSPQPPRPRMTRRKSVSVTPAMGASTAAGRIVRSLIWNCSGTIPSTLTQFLGVLLGFFAVGVRGIQVVVKLQEFSLQCTAKGRPILIARFTGERGAGCRHFRIQ